MIPIAPFELKGWRKGGVVWLLVLKSETLRKMTTGLLHNVASYNIHFRSSHKKKTERKLWDYLSFICVIDLKIHLSQKCFVVSASQLLELQSPWTTL